MSDDYENALNLDQMEDADIRGLVRQRLDEDADFDVDAVTISVDQGHVSVEGRVGTEGERQHVGQVLTGLGVVDFDNNVVVDEATRAQRAEAADDARAEDAAATASLGESGKRTTDSAEHLREDDASELYGTRDPQEAIQEGKSYTPPDGPVQEGVRSDERH